METTAPKDKEQAETSAPGHEDALQEILRTARRVTLTSRTAKELAAESADRADEAQLPD